MADTSIQWTNKVWNPTTGCTRVSPGCKNCYAFELHDKRHEAYKAGKDLPKQYGKPFTELQMFEDRLADPLAWKKPCREFTASIHLRDTKGGDLSEWPDDLKVREFPE